MGLSYIPYLSLTLWVLTFSCQIFSIYNWSKVLKFLYKTRQFPAHLRMSTILVIYILNCSAYNCLMVIHSGYMTFMWRPENSYNAYLIFWTFTPGFAALLAMQVIVLIMAIERCLILYLRLKYSKFHQNLLFRIAIFIMIIIASLVITFHSMDYPKESLTHCWAPGCLFSITATNVYTATKFTFAILIIFSSIYFIYLLQKYNKSSTALALSNEQVRQKWKICNFLVMYTICMEFVFNFVPYLISFLASTIFNVNISQYLGPYSLFLTSVEGCVCALLFASKLKKLDITIKISSIKNNFIGTSIKLTFLK